MSAHNTHRRRPRNDFVPRKCSLLVFTFPWEVAVFSPAFVQRYQEPSLSEKVVFDSAYSRA